MNYIVEAFNKYQLSMLLANAKTVLKDGINVKIYEPEELSGEEDKAIYSSLLCQYGWNYQDYDSMALYFYKNKLFNVSTASNEIMICGGVLDTKNDKPLSNIVVASTVALPGALYIFNESQMNELIKDF